MIDAAVLRGQVPGIVASFTLPDGLPQAAGTGALERGVTVVVCTLMRPASVARFIASLKRQTQRPDMLMIVDASPDTATEDLVRSGDLVPAAARSVRYVRVDRSLRGLTRQRNLALDLVTTDLVAFFDDDIVLGERSLEELERVHRAATVPPVGVGARIANEQQPVNGLWRTRRMLGIVGSLVPGSYHASGMSVPWAFLPAGTAQAEGDFLPGGAVMWRTADARRVRFNDDFAGYAQGEDLEFSLRVSAYGKLLLAGAATVEHLHEPSARPKHYAIGYMAIHNRYAIHRRCIKDRSLRHTAWFIYAWSVDTLMLARHLVVPSRIGDTLRQIGGRCVATVDILRKK